MFLPPYSNRNIVITMQLVIFLDTTFFKVVSGLQMQHFSGGLAIVLIKNLIIIPISAFYVPVWCPSMLQVFVASYPQHETQFEGPG